MCVMFDLFACIFLKFLYICIFAYVYFYNNNIIIMVQSTIHSRFALCDVLFILLV